MDESVDDGEASRHFSLSAGRLRSNFVAAHLSETEIVPNYRLRILSVHLPWRQTRTGVISLRDP